MMVYFVIASRTSEQASGLAERIAEHYSGSLNHVLVPNMVWAVADSLAASADVCQKLGIGTDAIGVVVRADQYYGMYDPALWQRMEQWEAANAG